MLISLHSLGKVVIRDPYAVIAAIVSAAMLFTPYYSIGYLGLLILSSRYLHPLRAFDSYFANFIIGVLLLSVSVMLAGIFTMLVDGPSLAISTAVTYTAIIIPILMYQPARIRKAKHITVLDAVLMGIALVGPLLIVGTQLSEHSLNTAVYRIANGDGWDNSPHIGLLQLNERYKSYIYPAADIGDGGVRVFNAYPQGWHLATSHISSGFGQPTFDTSYGGVLRSLIIYIAAVFAWCVIIVYVLLKYSEYLYSRAHKRLSIILQISTLGAASLFPLLLVLLSAMYQGFVNYLSVIPYILLLVAASIQLLDNKTRNESTTTYIVLAVPLLAGITLLWTLPAPGMALMCLIVVFASNNFLNSVKAFKKIPVLVGVCTAAVPSLVYAYILTKNIGFSQVYINTGYIAGFPRPEFALILAAIVGFGIYKNYITITFQHLLFIFSPLVVYMFALWLTSYVKNDTIGYYQSKMFALIVVILIMLATPIIMRMAVELSANKNRYVGVATSFFVAVCLVGGVIILSNNPLNLGSLKKSSLGDSNLAQYAIDWTYKLEPRGSDQLLVFGDNMDATYNKSMLFNVINTRTSIGYYTDRGPKDASKNALKCVQPSLFYIGNVSHYSQEQVLNRLSDCLEARNKEGFSTTIASTESNRQQLEAINTYSAKIVYVKR